MKKSLVIAMLLSGMITTGADAGSMKRIKTEADFRSMIVDKTLSSEFGTVKAKSNGKLTGKLKNGKFKGSWNWQKGFYCRSAKVGKKDLGFNCHVVQSDGVTVTFIRDQGKGPKSNWSIK